MAKKDMMKIQPLIKLAIALLLISTSNQLVKQKLLLELYRHGSRTPFKNLLNETYFDDLGPSTLYANGMRQHLMLGRQLAQNYSRIFSETQKENFALTYSSSEQRCILSAQSHNMGIFDLGTGTSVTSTNTQALNPPSPIDVDQPTDNFALSQGYWPSTIITQMNRTEDTMFMPRGESCTELEKDILFDVTESFKGYPLVLEKVKSLNQKLDDLGYGCKRSFKG